MLLELYAYFGESIRTFPNCVTIKQGKWAMKIARAMGIRQWLQLLIHAFTFKNAKWDKQDGYVVNRDCYNSYLYLVENTNTTHIDKFILHGRELNQYLDGGSALHLNLEETLTYKNALNLLNIAAKAGCNYFCVNVKITICNTCDAIDKRTLYACPSCGSEDIDHGTRVIGYLKRVSAFSKGRRDEHALRHYHTHTRVQS